MHRLRTVARHPHLLLRPLRHHFSTSLTSSDPFLAPHGVVSWSSLGLSDSLARSLYKANLNQPSLTQAACVPTILSGEDAVITAETGGGKTYGYLVPIVERLRRNSKPDLRQISVIVCPNVVLCDQVVRMVNRLCDDGGAPLVFADVMRGTRGWPHKQPGIVVSTPHALLSYLYAVHRERNRPFKFLRSVKYVVFDEADMLLSGSFLNKVIRLVHFLQFAEKYLSQTRALVDEERKYSNSNLIPHSDSGDGEHFCDAVDMEHWIKEAESGPGKRKGPNQAQDSYARSKQYIFVAATLPLNRKKTSRGILRRFFPDAKWISGNYLYRHNPRLQQRWVEVSIDTQVNALIDALDQQPASCKSGSGVEIGRTMVFANSVEAVESVAQKLLIAGIKCTCYHTSCTLEKKMHILAEFQVRGGVLVCTDDVARGLDISNVSHVIQAEFATSPVDYLHRLGRTARAGQPGLVTSLYSESNRDVVDAVREAEKLGIPVWAAFSEKRTSSNELNMCSS